MFLGPLGFPQIFHENELLDSLFVQFASQAEPFSLFDFMARFPA